MLSMTTDYAASRDCAQPYLREIASAGFSHIHWCHQWNTDYLYSDDEIAQIGGWMKDCGLSLTDLHASAGASNNWLAAQNAKRLRGVELVKNRIEMAARLGADVIILHMPAERGWFFRRARFRDALRKSMDAITRFGAPRGVRIALENLSPGNFDGLARVFDSYGPESVGLCYDAGHGRLAADGLDRLERMTDRLISMHLHDNNGKADQHMLLFSGKVDWGRLARIIARSPYDKPINMEVTMKMYDNRDASEFLAEAFETGTRFSGMVDAKRAAP